MAKSDDHIDYKAYIGYLRKMTCEKDDPSVLRRRIRTEADLRRQGRMGGVILKWLFAVIVIVILISVVMTILF